MDSRPLADLRARISVFALLFSFFISANGLAQESVSEVNDLAAQPYQFFNHMWAGTRDIPSSQTLWILAAGSALTAGAFALDHEVRDFFKGHDRLGKWDKYGNEYLGTGIPGVVFAIGSVGLGLIGGNRLHIEAGQAHIEGLIATFAYTSLLKVTVRRERPSGANFQSFPSGHTSTMFSSAASLMGMYGPAAGIPALALATFTGVSRLEVNAHWLSDVCFGATLGYIVGGAYTLHHLRNLEMKKDEPKVAILPYFSTRRDFGLHLKVGLN